MKFFGFKLSGMNLGTGIAIGAGAAILGPAVVPAVGGALKSLGKAAIKGGIIAWEQGRSIAEEAKETFDDLAAEAKAEMKEEAATPVAALPAATAKTGGKKKTNAKEAK